METQHIKKVDPIYAFPGSDSEYFLNDSGMELRDYFAAKALQGLWASHAHPEAGAPHLSSKPLMAQKCYEMADEMMKAREKATGKS